jgi:dipeptidyl aminopeptidase/acylaminoacyl peptidase
MQNDITHGRKRKISLRLIILGMLVVVSIISLPCFALNPAAEPLNGTGSTQKKRVILHASLSTDHHRLVLVTSEEGTFNSYAYEVWLIDISSGIKRKLPFVPSYSEVLWQPHGDLLGYCTDTAETYDTRTGVRRRFSSAISGVKLGDVMFREWPAWSPDGRRIAYTSEIIPDPGPISCVRPGMAEESRYLLSIDVIRGGPLVTEAVDVAGRLAWCWSPDSKSILYVSDPTIKQPHPKKTRAKAFPYKWAVTKLSWSPNGSYLAALSMTPSATTAIILDKTMKQRICSASASLRRIFIWSPDSKQLVFSVELPDRSGNTVPAVLHIPERKIIRLNSAKLRNAIPITWMRALKNRDRVLFISRYRDAILVMDLATKNIQRVISLDSKGQPLLFKQ